MEITIWTDDGNGNLKTMKIESGKKYSAVVGLSKEPRTFTIEVEHNHCNGYQNGFMYLFLTEEATGRDFSIYPNGGGELFLKECKSLETELQKKVTKCGKPKSLKQQKQCRDSLKRTPIRYNGVKSL